VPPIADTRGVDATIYSKGERFLRCKLAALFRLINQQGWAPNILNHISARVPGESDAILINPFGLQYHEISASTLAKLDSHGNIVHPGSTTFGVNKVAVVVHTAIHKARPDVRCVVYLMQPDVQAVSALRCGVLRTSLESCVLGGISYHDFEGLSVNDSEKETLARDLGAVNKVMILRNQGALICGATIEEAWELTNNLVQASQTQLRALQASGGNPDNLSIISDELAQRTYAAAWSGETNSNSDKSWKLGEMHFEALMRDLDNCGMRTGYIYKNPLIKTPAKQKFDVEVPPASSSLGYFSDSEALRPTRNGRDRYIHAGGYERIEAEVFSDGDVPNEPGTKIKWVRKDEDVAVKIDGPHQFTPVISGKKEMKAKINHMKDDRDANKAGAGYHSRILDGLSQQDQQRYQEATLQGVNQNVVAMSKGIIQKEYRKDAVLLTDYSAPNPFDCVTDDEVETYRKQAERRAKGLPDEQPPSPPAAQQTSDRYRYDEKSRKAADKKKAGTIANPGAPQQPAPQSPGSGTETGAESGLDKGFTTGGETDLEAHPEGKKSSKKDKEKTKSFRLFSNKKK
jgi:adducin